MNKLTAFAQFLRGHTRLISVVLCVILAAGGVIRIVGRSAATPAPAQPAAAMTVTVAAATQAQWPATLDASGAIAPWQEAVIGAQVSGLRLAAIRVNVGDRVERGQVLAVFDADLLRADQARLKAAWQQAEANRQRALQLVQAASASRTSCST